MSKEKTIKELLELLLTEYDSRMKQETYNRNGNKFVGLCVTMDTIKASKEDIKRLRHYIQDHKPTYTYTFWWSLSKIGHKLRRAFVVEHIKLNTK